VEKVIRIMQKSSQLAIRKVNVLIKILILR
jgi:hypothetical protein